MLVVELGQTGLAEDLVGEGAGQGGDRLDEPDKEGGRCNISGAANEELDDDFNNFSIFL